MAIANYSPRDARRATNHNTPDSPSCFTANIAPGHPFQNPSNWTLPEDSSASWGRRGYQILESLPCTFSFQHLGMPQSAIYHPHTVVWVYPSEGKKSSCHRNHDVIRCSKAGWPDHDGPRALCNIILEPCQVRKEAALRGTLYVPQESRGPTHCR